MQTAYGQQAYEAASAQQTQERPKIAVYAFGAETPVLNKAIANRLIAALSNSGRYTVLDEYKEFFLQAANEPKSDVTSLNIEQIQRLGWNFGAEYVCLAEITTVLGESQISARVIEVETGNVAAIGVADSPLKVLTDVADASERIVTTMFKNVPPPVIVAAPPPVTIAQPAVAPNRQTNMYTDQDLRRALAPVEPELPPYRDFSGSARFWTCYLNAMVPGLGSGIIMRDWNGLALQIALTTLGWGLYGIGAAVDSRTAKDIFAYGGYIALGTNFTYNIVRSATYKKPYDAPPKFTSADTVNVGFIWGNGAFFGVDFNSAYGIGSYTAERNSATGLMGFGLGFGNVYDFGNQMYFVYGMFAGIWYIRESDADENNETNRNFLAPFVKLRWSFMEFTYRGLLGNNEKSNHNYRNYNNQPYHDERFGWNNHQLMVGFHFATSKRERK